MKRPYEFLVRTSPLGTKRYCSRTHRPIHVLAGQVSGESITNILDKHFLAITVHAKIVYCESPATVSETSSWLWMGT